MTQLPQTQPRYINVQAIMLSMQIPVAQPNKRANIATQSNKLLRDFPKTGVNRKPIQIN
jgi:hypothetical protein